MARPQQALALIEAHLQRTREADNPSQLLQMLYYKAWAHVELRQWQAAEVALVETQQLLQQGAGQRNLKSLIESCWAELALGRGDFALANQHVDAALSLAGHTSDKPERALVRILLLAADIALAQAQPSAAQRYASEALRIGERVARNPNGSADVGESLILLANAGAGVGPAAEQRKLLERALRCLQASLYAEHPLVREARARLKHLES